MIKSTISHQSKGLERTARTDRGRPSDSKVHQLVGTRDLHGLQLHRGLGLRPSRVAAGQRCGGQGEEPMPWGQGEFGRLHDGFKKLRGTHL